MDFIMDSAALQKLGQLLITNATEARETAYAPYSNFKVGAALLTDERRIFQGCNVENIAYGSTMCAERVAIFKAVSDNVQKFEAIAVVAHLDSGTVVPCGACLQVLSEFCGPELTVFLASTKDPENFITTTLGALFPCAPSTLI